jgi:hypothetical protein
MITPIRVVTITVDLFGTGKAQCGGQSVTRTLGRPISFIGIDIDVCGKLGVGREEV